LTGDDAVDNTLGNKGATRPSDDQLRQQVPWLAVIGFDPLEELGLTPDELKSLPYREQKSPTGPAVPLPQKIPKSLDPATTKPPPTGAYSMTVAQYLNLFTSPDRPKYEVRPREFDPIIGGQDSTSKEVMNVIFPRKSLIRQLFGSKGENIEQHKFLAHARKINTQGMPDIDPADQEQGLFSVVFSHRTGKSTA
jgi:hypothetical protein